MRTTIDLPADLHHVVTSVAAHTRKSMNQTVADLIRRGLVVGAVPAEGLVGGPGHDKGPRLQQDALTGLPLICSSRPVTAEDVRALDDEE